MARIGGTVGERLALVRLVVGTHLIPPKVVTQAALGAWVGAEEGREAYYNATVSTWERNETVPTIAQVAALSRAVQRRTGLWIDPGWIAFGAESKAPPPAGVLELAQRADGAGETPTARRARSRARAPKGEASPG